MQPRCLSRMTVRQAMPVLKALANERRLQILESVAQAPKSISQIGSDLGIEQAAVSQGVQILEEAGLVRTVTAPGTRGLAKIVHPAVDNILLQLPSRDEPSEQEEEVEMPIGLYTDLHVAGTCGFATAHEFVWPHNDPSTFHHPKRTEAQLIWLADGFIEYVFPYQLGADMRPTRLEISAEVCSEVKDYDEDYPSDITLWVNEREIGTVRVPGDMGARHGRLTPSWVPHGNTQYGFLTYWAANEDGFWVNQFRGGDGRIGDLDLRRGKPIVVRFGFKEGAVRGGLNLFGSKCGDFDQAIRMRLVGEPCQTPVERLLSEVQDLLTSS